MTTKEAFISYSGCFRNKVIDGIKQIFNEDYSRGEMLIFHIR